MDGLVVAVAFIAGLGTLGLHAASQGMRSSDSSAREHAGLVPRPAPPAEPGARKPAQSITSVAPVVIEQAQIATLPRPTTRPTPQATARPTPPRRTSSRTSRRSSRYRQPTPTRATWAPPDGPVRIALQAGHWRADEAPRELSGLKGNGTAFQGTAEWETNLDIARRAATMLRELGYEVDVLPAVIPPGYRAHLFIAIHADGSNDPNASGYRVAAPRRDPTGRAAEIVRLLEQSYGQETGLRHLSTVTRRMQNYYAFNYRRYEHSLDPRTISAIIETGFLTSSRDRRVIMNDPDRAARGIVQAVSAFSETPPPLSGASDTRSGRD